MITLKNQSLNAKEISMLATYKKLLDGSTMLNIYKETKPSDSRIRNSIEKTLKAKNLLSDEHFFETGQYHETFTNIVSLHTLEFDGLYYITDTNPTRLTTSKIKGTQKASREYRNTFQSFKQHDGNGTVMISIDSVHDIAYEKHKKPVKIDLEINGGTFEIGNCDHALLSNPIGAALKEHFVNTINQMTEDDVEFNGEHLVIRRNERTFFDYLKNPNRYSMSNGNLQIDHETLYIHDEKFASNVLIQKAIEHLNKSIIPSRRLKSMIGEIMDKEEFKHVHHKISLDTLYNQIQNNIENHPNARKHKMIADDLMETTRKHQRKFDVLTSKRFTINQYLNAVIKVDSNTKEVIIVSKYLTAFPSNKEESAMNPGDYKKALIYDRLKDHLKKHKVKTTIYTESKKATDDYFHFTSIPFQKQFHDRYLIIHRKDDTDYYSLSAELDNFDWADNRKDYIVLRDTKVMKIEKEQVPSVILHTMEGKA